MGGGGFLQLDTGTMGLPPSLAADIAVLDEQFGELLKGATAE